MSARQATYRSAQDTHRLKSLYDKPLKNLPKLTSKPLPVFIISSPKWDEFANFFIEQSLQILQTRQCKSQKTGLFDDCQNTDFLWKTKRQSLHLMFWVSFRARNGGRDWDWTSDPYDVNVVLSRWATRPSTAPLVPNWTDKHVGSSVVIPTLRGLASAVYRVF